MKKHAWLALVLLLLAQLSCVGGHVLCGPGQHEVCDTDPITGILICVCVDD